MTWPRFATAIVLTAAAAAILSACGPAEESPSTLSTDPVVQQGVALAKSNGCLSCHSANGSARSGPTFKGLAGRQVTLATGQVVSADDEYLRLAITDPDKEIVKGYHAGVMSAAMKNEKKLSGDDVNAIVAYIKELR